MKFTLSLLLTAALPLLAADPAKPRKAKPAPAAMVPVATYNFEDHIAGKAINDALRGAGIDFNILTGSGATIDVDAPAAAAARDVLEKLVAKQHVAVHVIKADGK